MGCFCILGNQRRATRRQSSQHNDDLSGGTNITKYTYRELVRVTENFNLSNKIGEGGFGSVYKGKLRNGKLVAVKVLSSESRQGVKEFLNELMAISNISHENLVNLYGYCVEGNQRILVYNYLENNSLAQTLLGSGHSNIQFNWATRFPEITNGVLLLQTWAHYEEGDLERIIDASLDDDLDVAQACRFLKVGLLCTQDVTKRRPSMSAVVCLLTGERDVDSEKISKPAIISDFMDLKVRSMRKDNGIATTSSTLLSSIMAHSSPLLSQETTEASMTFTAISDRE
ncbi:hypothetical protein ABZP36_023383 [Zizania latifolia]